MKRFYFKSIQHRLVVLLLLPVAILLLASGIGGFILSRDALLEQWESSAILKVERAAQSVELRLNRIIEWMEMFHETGRLDARQPSQQWIIRKLESLEGVARVQMIRTKDGIGHESIKGSPTLHLHGKEERELHFHGGRILKLTAPSLNTQQGLETVSIYSMLVDANSREVGQLRVDVSFDHLMQDIRKYGWWQSERAFLIDNTGHFVLHTASYGKQKAGLGEVSDPFELQILEQIRKNPSGTVWDSGHPPKHIAGYHTIESAQWSIVLVAPGSQLLAPIIAFRNYFLIGVLALSVIVVALTRHHLRRLVRPVQELTLAAEAVAHEKFDIHIKPHTRDEIGQLANSFNAMVSGLRERAYIRNTFGRYIDHGIARRLLEHPEAARMGGDKRQVAILMADIRNFTPLAESITPEATISLLNFFFSHMIRVVSQYKGIIVDFMGDGLLAFFTPIDEDQISIARSAVACGLAMQGRMTKLRQEAEGKQFPDFKMGVGVNIGDVIVGNIGSEERTKYGIVGSAVNATQRIQSLAEGGQVVISEFTRNLLGDRVEIARQFSKVPKGFHQALTLYVVRHCQCEIESGSDAADA